MIAMIEQIETAMAKRNEFIKNLPDGPSFSLGLTQEGHAGLENENEYLDFSLMDDDAGDVQFVRSGRRSTGIVINDNGNADERICDKQRLENDRMEKQLYESLPGESDQANRRREIAKGKRKVQDVEHFGGYNSEISKETEFVEPLPHQMEKRNRATIKKTEKFMSPYVVRAVDISTKVSKNEKELWYWIFYNDEANNEDILFASDDVSINRGDMLTMRQNTMIRSNILDAWSSVMNHKELSRSPDSPYRFFASTNPSCFEIDDLNGSYDKKKLMGKFIRDFDRDLSKMKGIKLGKIELFVFPVYAMEHYQIVCFNVKTFRVDVIDDKVPSTVVDDSASVSVPLLLCEAFSNYLRIKGMRAKAAALSKIEVATPDLPCRGKHKNSDCWIYTMRHMKTYMGEGVKNWKCGRSSCETLLKKMRIKYCAEILCADINVRKEYNTKEASFHYRASSGDGPINIDKLLRNN